MASTIGIKVANGDFYSIVDENSLSKKRLVLTTVHDNQRSVQIDLYKSYARTMADAFYIGSLVLENIKPRPKGEPSIELVISSALNGDITADAIDMDPSAGKDRQSMTVSLKSLEDDNREYELPDFELEQNETPAADLYDHANRIRLYQDEEVLEEEHKRFPWLVVFLAALVLTAIGVFAWLYFSQSGSGRTSAARPVAQVTETQQVQPAAPATPAAQATPATPAASAQPAEQSAPAAQSVATQPAKQAEPPVIQAPAQAPARNTQASRDRLTPPVASYNVPSVIPKEGVPYKIRYGDTLWAISEAFYRNPWLYPRIAQFNNIRNPDLIISGTTILVPPRN